MNLPLTHCQTLPSFFLFSCGTKLNNFTGLLFSQPSHNLCQFSNCYQPFVGLTLETTAEKVWKKEKTQTGCVHQHTSVDDTLGCVTQDCHDRQQEPKADAVTAGKRYQAQDDFSVLRLGGTKGNPSTDASQVSFETGDVILLSIMY